MPETKPTCLVCNQTSDEIPLIAISYQGRQYWICPSDFPVLIHQPGLLVGKLPGADRLRPREHD